MLLTDRDKNLLYPQPWLQDETRPQGFWSRTYAQWADPGTGVLVASVSYAPKDPMIQAGHAPAPLMPQLRRWSDYTALIWKQACDDVNVSPQNLQWIGRENVVNDDTLAVVNAAFTRLGLNHDPWPGHRFGMDDEVEKAIMGCPSGKFYKKARRLRKEERRYAAIRRQELIYPRYRVWGRIFVRTACSDDRSKDGGFCVCVCR